MASLFISYSRKDIDGARKLTKAFHGQELDFWIDWEGIPPTVDWWKEIEKGIEEADIFLFLISPDSCRSKVCKKEIEHAVRNGKRLIPVVVRDTKSDESPAELRPLNWIYWREADDFQTSFGKLITAIRTDYAWVQAHRELQVKALEWERTNHDNSLLLRGRELQDAEIDLATNTSKEPHPTDLQREYVLRSRQTSDRQRTIVTGIAITGLVALAALAVFGFVQAGLATDRANIANTAQANAEEQTKIALARQLSAQAQLLLGSGYERQMSAVLLAVQSMRLFPSADAGQILHNNTLARPIAHFTQDNTVYSVAFSPDGKYVASGGLDGTVLLWDVSAGKEIARMTHDDWVQTVAFSPDGSYLLSAGSDTIRLWEVPSGKEITHMIHDGDVTSVAISSDGTYVVSAAGRTAHVWNAAKGSEVAHVTHDDVVTSVVFRPDGKSVASGSYDWNVRIWEAATGDEISRIDHNGEVNSLAFSPNGEQIVSGGTDGLAYVWDVSSGEAISAMEHLDAVNAIAFSPDGERIISAGAYAAQVWNVEPVQEKVSFAAPAEEASRWEHNEVVLSVAFSPDGEYTASASLDGTIRVWEASTGQEIARMSHDDAVWSIAFSPDGKYLVSGGCKELDMEESCLEGSVRVWAASPGKAITTMNHDELESVNYLAFSPDGTYIASGTLSTVHVWETSRGTELAALDHRSEGVSFVFSRDGKYVLSVGGNTARVWEAASGKEIVRLTHPDEVWSVAFSPDGKRVITGSLDGTVRMWEVASGKELASMQLEGTAHYVAFSPDGQSIIGGGDTSIFVWETSNGREIARMGHDGDLMTVAISPDGKFVASGGLNATARVWEISTGREIFHVTYGDEVTFVAFSPDGAYVVAAGCDRVDEAFVCTQSSTRVLDTASGSEIARRTHDGEVTAVAVSPDGKYVVTGECDRLGGDFACVQASARVWEASTGNEITRLTQATWINDVAFSPDGKYVATASDDSTTRLWLWKPNELIADACAYLTRNLTAAEWEQYIGDIVEYQAVCPNLPLEPENIPTPTSTEPGKVLRERKAMGLMS